MKSSLLNALRGEDIKALSKSPLFEVLLKDLDVEIWWTPKWEVENMIKYIDKIPSRCIGVAIIEDKKYRIPEIIQVFLKRDIKGVEKWGMWRNSDLLNAFNGENLKALSKSPLFMVLLKDYGVEYYWTPKWEVADMIEHIDKIPTRYVCKAIIADKKYCIPEIFNKLDPISVKEMDNNMKVNFLNVLGENYLFDNLVIPLQAVLSWKWIETEKEWTPQWSVDDFVKYINEIPALCVARVMNLYKFAGIHLYLV